MATAIHQYEDKLLDFAYGELPAPEASAVESHVKSCPRCTQALAQIKGVRTSMAALPQLAAPDAGLDSLLAYAEQAAARNAAGPRAGLAPWWRRFVAPLAGACALALVVVVAVQTQEGGMDEFKKESAMKAAKAEGQADERRALPAPVVAAAPPPAAEPLPDLSKNKGDEGAQFAGAADKNGKVQKAMQVDRAKAKSTRAWDTDSKQNALARNDNNYEQALGTTAAPTDEEDRQAAQKQELGEALKQSKTRRETSSLDYGNARGGYAQEKEAKEEAKKKEAPMGATKDFAPSAPPPPQAAQPAPAPTKAPQVNAPAVAEDAKPAPKPKPSIGFGLSNSGPSTGSSSSSGSGVGALGTRAPSRDNSDDDAAGRGLDQLAERKRLNDDIAGQQRELEAEARPHLEAARSASMQSNYQEEVKQALYALQTGVRGAPRAEALTRLCSALTELGSEGQATQYCDALIAEFPNTAAAKVAANRRKELQGGKPATAKKSAPRQYDSEKAEPAPAKVRPAEAAPASSY